MPNTKVASVKKVTRVLRECQGENSGITLVSKTTIVFIAAYAIKVRARGTFY